MAPLNLLLVPTVAPLPADRPWLDVALGAERWLAATAVRTARGLTWPADPLTPASVQTNLYSGSPGVVVFLSELASITRDGKTIERRQDGAMHLWAEVQGTVEPRTVWGGDRAGLYTGLAGVAFALECAARATQHAPLRDGAQMAVNMLATTAVQTAGTAVWNDSNDIISGTTGIGLTLLWARHALGRDDLLPLARRAGERLIDTAIERPSGLTWAIAPSVPRRYPNFSHGAAGVSYFLLRLYQATKEQAFLDTALRGAVYLESIASRTRRGRLIFHSEPGNESLYYLSWCHGPSGTARFFHALAAETGAERWSALARDLEIGTEDLKVPERSPGFWNNVSQCCGNCGVLEYLLARHDAAPKEQLLTYARKLAGDVRQRATERDGGLCWVQAENRTQPDLLVAQTGLMQGAAGVGLAMLHLDGTEQGRARFVVRPDD